MNEKFCFVKKEEAIKILENSNSEYVLLSTLNLDTNESDDIKKITKAFGNKIINDAKSITLCTDSMFTNLGLYSYKQNDIKNIKSTGICKTLLVCKGVGD